MNDFITNIAMLLYIGAILVHKLLGYSYFTAAWRSLLFVIAIGIVLLLATWSYRTIVNHASMNASELQNSETGSNS